MRWGNGLPSEGGVRGLLPHLSGSSVPVYETSSAENIHTPMLGPSLVPDGHHSHLGWSQLPGDAETPAAEGPPLWFLSDGTSLPQHLCPPLVFSLQTFSLPTSLLNFSQSHSLLPENGKLMMFRLNTNILIGI